MTVATIYASRDADGVSSSAGGVGTTGTVSGSTTTTLSVGTISGCSGPTYFNSLFWFDVASLAGKYVISASFNYWITANVTTLQVKAFRATSPWAEVDSSPGPTYDLTDYSADLVLTPSGAYMSLTDAKFKEWIQNWIDSVYSNYGFVLDWVSGTSFVQMASQDTSGTANDPYLSVTYTSKPVVSNVGTPSPSASVPAAGNVTVGLTFSDADGDTMAQVAIRRIRLTGA